MDDVAPLSLIRVIDTETTDLSEEAEVCEIGWTDVRLFPQGWEIETGPVSQLCSVGRIIEPEARAAHHITDEELEDMPTFHDVLPRVLEGVDFFAAHNAEFDKKFFGDGRLQWLCTMKLAAALWRDYPSYTNQALRYRRGLEFEHPEKTLPSHRAGPDTYVTAALLIDLLQEVDSKGRPWSMKALLKTSAEPRRIMRFTFGKHKGVLLRDAPTDYLEWIVFKSEMDEAIKWNCRRELDRR